MTGLNKCDRKDIGGKKKQLFFNFKLYKMSTRLKLNKIRHQNFCRVTKGFKF
jgi:hypothetical protein